MLILFNKDNIFNLKRKNMKKLFLLIFIYTFYMFSGPIEDLKHVPDLEKIKKEWIRGWRPKEPLRWFVIRRQYEKAGKEIERCLLERGEPEFKEVNFLNNADQPILIILDPEKVVTLGKDTISESMILPKNREIELVPYSENNKEMLLGRTFKFRLPNDTDLVIYIVSENGIIKLQNYDSFIEAYDISDYEITFKS